MKKIKTKQLFILLAYFVMLTCVNTSCSSDKESDHSITNLTAVGQYVEDKDNLSGIISYNNSIDKWFIQVPVEGSIDHVTCYYPVQIDPSFCTNRLRIRFSGKLYQLDETLKSQIPQVGGYDYYAIQITQIREDD